MHSCIPEEQINQLITEKKWLSEYDQWEIGLNYPDLFIEGNTPIICMDVSANGRIILNCSCDDLTPEDWKQYMEYYQAVLPSLSALPQWEEQYGPAKFWNAEVNGAFFQTYGRIPNETYWQYTNEKVVCSVPGNEIMSSVEALEIARNILSDHFNNLLQEKRNLDVGSFYIKSSNCYAFHFYWLNEQNTLEEVCYVNINADSGLCHHAVRYCLLAGEEQLPLESYYSDIYYFVPMEDGSFIRNDQL